MPATPTPPTTTATDTTDQSQYVDTQNSSINIDDVYNNIIQIIDLHRSCVSVVNNEGLINQLITALNTATQSSNSPVDPNQYFSQVIVSPTVQESRCHAFYRLIGLPVLSPTENILYSPGFDASNSYKNPILNQHYQVVNSIMTGSPALFALMDARELNVNAFYSIFAQSNIAIGLANINASVLGLSSVGGGKTRKFSDCVVALTGPFDTNPSHQSYSVLNWNSIQSAQLTSYTDANGNPPNQLFSGAPPPFFTRAHYLAPFMVDPRIDLTVQPPQARVCAPYIVDSSKSVYAGDTSTGIVLTRPFIEYVCNARFNTQTNPSAVPERYQDLTSYIATTPSVNDQQLINSISQGVATTVEDQIFQKNFNIMRAMINTLYNAISDIQTVEANYHWLPIPDPVKGLEGVIGTQSIVIQTLADGTVQLDPLATTRERNIMTLTARIALTAPNVQEPTPDIGGFAFSSVQPLPDSSVSVGFGDLSQTSLNNQTKQRQTATDKAAAALREIEIVMGEFTGLGLCDIIAIYTALWTVDGATLVNMLDDQAFARMAANPDLLAPEVQARVSAGARNISAQEVAQTFLAQVQLMFQTMDRLYIDRLLFNIQ